MVALEHKLWMREAWRRSAARLLREGRRLTIRKFRGHLYLPVQPQPLLPLRDACLFDGVMDASRRILQIHCLPADTASEF